MKKYKKYMDEVKVSETLHRRLTELEAPKARPAAWKRYGAVAAALVLVAGIGAWGLGRTGVFGPAAEHGGPEIVPEGDIGVPDIALEDPRETLEPGQKTLGGYEVTYGGMTSYYLLPWIDYGMSDTRSEMSLDWDVPEGSLKRDLTREDIAALFGGEENLSVHLGWGDYTLTGWAAWLEDGSFWGAFINGTLAYYGGVADRFEFAVTAGQLPPTCIVYSGSVEQEIYGVMVTADKFDEELEFEDRSISVSNRWVSFMKDGYGYRFDMSSGDSERAEEQVSRLVRWLIQLGVTADAVTADGAVLAHPWEADPNYSVGEPNWNDSGMDTPAYDPDDGAAPAYSAPVLDPFAGGQPGEESPALPDEVPEEDLVVPADPGLWTEGSAVDDVDLDLEAVEPN